MRPTTRMPVLPLLALAALGCGGDDDEPAAPLPRCTGAVEVTVGTGTTPTISWTPRCLVTRISVYQPLSAANERWRVLSTAGIAPDVRYGTTPRGATLVVGPDPLVAGTEAAVELLVQDDFSGQVVGGTGFTP